MPGKENERGGVWKVKADAEDRNWVQNYTKANEKKSSQVGKLIGRTTYLIAIHSFTL